MRPDVLMFTVDAIAACFAASPNGLFYSRIIRVVLAGTSARDNTLDCR